MRSLNSRVYTITIDTKVVKLKSLVRCCTYVYTLSVQRIFLVHDRPACNTLFQSDVMTRHKLSRDGDFKIRHGEIIRSAIFCPIDAA